MIKVLIGVEDLMGESGWTRETILAAATLLRLAVVSVEGSLFVSWSLSRAELRRILKQIGKATF